MRASLSSDQVKVTARISDANKVYLCHRETSFHPWQRVEMFDNGGDGDTSAGDGIYSMTVNGKKGMEYYLIAEQAKVVTLSPERSGREVHTVR